MLGNILLIIAGLALLTWGADRFVHGAASAARNMGVAPLLIGLTVVAFATSAPEILVSIVAASQNQPGLAVGNAIGSNIVNIGLVLGVTALADDLHAARDLANAACEKIHFDGAFYRHDIGDRVLVKSGKP